MSSLLAADATVTSWSATLAATEVRSRTPFRGRGAGGKQPIRCE
jgi:hypothetical protein